MASTSTYLNFGRCTEEAFLFYRSVFGGAFNGQGIMRLGDVPPQAGGPVLSEEDKQLVMHVELPILGGHLLMGTDAPESMGFRLINGNTVHIMLTPDSKEETERLFEALSARGKVTLPLQEMFWGSYYGTCIDRFGVQWMFNFPLQNQMM